MDSTLGVGVEYISVFSLFFKFLNSFVTNIKRDNALQQKPVSGLHVIWSSFLRVFEYCYV